MDMRREMPPQVKALTPGTKQEIRDTLALMHPDSKAYKGFVRWYIGCLRSQPYGEPEPTIFLN